MTIVYANLHGGLGNQLFIVFSCVATALRDKCDFYIDGKYDNSQRSDLTHSRKTYWSSPLFTNLEKHMSTKCKTEFCSVFKENKDYQSLIPDANESIKKCLVLSGYFQSPMFFENYKETIINMMCIRQLQEKVFLKTNKTTICMHFRLGDYKEIQHIHPIMPLEYYENSLYYLTENIKNTELCVLWTCHSPDKEDVKKDYISELCKKFSSVTFEELPICDNDYEELLLMSLCNHFIIPNSTFSWWAAYLSNQENKIVCYPETWFGHYDINTISNSENSQRMFPKDWKKISFNINLVPIPTRQVKKRGKNIKIKK